MTKFLCAKSLQSCPTLCNAMDCSPPGSSVHENSRAKTLEWVAIISFSKGFPSPGTNSPPLPQKIMKAENPKRVGFGELLGW